jgi:hypothetical protein
MYEHKYGTLPAEHVLIARTERRDEARFERQAWGPAGAPF